MTLVGNADSLVIASRLDDELTPIGLALGNTSGAVMSYKGKYRPSNKHKYRGDHTNIIYRSLWEKKFMHWCDRNNNVLEWGSEEIIIPYKSPVDNRIHRYYPDFYVRARTKDGRIAKSIIEIKPAAQTKPPKRGKKKPRTFLSEVKTWGVNSAKWRAARQFCAHKGFQFIILTENHLNV